MSVITVSKSLDEIVLQVRKHGDLETVVLGCDKCAKTSKTGGALETRELRERLRRLDLRLREIEGLVEAVEEGLCDPKAVPERTRPLAEAAGAGTLQVLVLACGAGLKCLQDALPGIRLIPGLDTLGPGVKGELACLACGDCSFGETGCKMVRIGQEQTLRLTQAYRRV